MSLFLKPNSLNKDDQAVIISPSGNMDFEYINKAKSVLENWGLKVNLGKYASNKFGRYAGTVEERLADLQMAMDSEEVKLIFCSRGGYGIVQLLEKIDYTLIKKSPKWLVGYSDITALHLAFLQEGIASIHAPMARHLAENPGDDASVLLKDLLFQGTSKYCIDPHELNKTGKIKGTIFGGNLAVMSGLIGTPYFKVPKNGILFIEDIGESPYKIDRMMWNLRLSGALESLSGLIVGRFADCEEDPLMGKTIYESINDIVSDYDYPVCFDFPVGHVHENYPLMQGENYTFEVTKNKIILEYSK